MDKGNKTSQGVDQDAGERNWQTDGDRKGAITTRWVIVGHGGEHGMLTFPEYKKKRSTGGNPTSHVVFQNVACGFVWSLIRTRVMPTLSKNRWLQSSLWVWRPTFLGGGSLVNCPFCPACPPPSRQRVRVTKAVPAANPQSPAKKRGPTEQQTDRQTDRQHLISG